MTETQQLTHPTLADRLRAVLADLRSKADAAALEARALHLEGYSVWSQDFSSRAKGLRQACDAIDALLTEGTDR